MCWGGIGFREGDTDGKRAYHARHANPAEGVQGQERPDGGALWCGAQRGRGGGGRRDVRRYPQTVRRPRLTPPVANGAPRVTALSQMPHPTRSSATPRLQSRKQEEEEEEEEVLLTAYNK